ncbi:MAG: hypothetical protein KDB44_17950, partial [Mycobacterium sp.]|nr:hypothetical protein [Mycobacterium sp.]
AEGEWIPPGAPGSHWVRSPGGIGTHEEDEYVGRRRAPDDPPQQPFVPVPPAAEPPRGRHYAAPTQAPAMEDQAPEAPAPAPPTPPPPTATEPEDPEDPDGGAHTGGQSVAELLARLQATPSGGGRRRRRED